MKKRQQRIHGGSLYPKAKSPLCVASGNLCPRDTVCASGTCAASLYRASFLCSSNSAKFERGSGWISALAYRLFKDKSIPTNKKQEEAKKANRIVLGSTRKTIRVVLRWHLMTFNAPMKNLFSGLGVCCPEAFLNRRDWFIFTLQRNKD